MAGTNIKEKHEEEKRSTYLDIVANSEGELYSMVNDANIYTHRILPTPVNDKEDENLTPYQEIIFTEDGDVHVVTRNAVIPVYERVVGNFTYPKVFRLQSTSGESGVFLLQFKLHKKDVDIFLDEKKCNKIDYIMGKMLVVGAGFYSRTKRYRMDTALALWKALTEPECPIKVIPDDIGWMESEKGITFVEEDELTWKKVIDSLNKSL